MFEPNCCVSHAVVEADVHKPTPVNSLKAMFAFYIPFKLCPNRFDAATLGLNGRWNVVKKETRWNIYSLGQIITSSLFQSPCIFTSPLMCLLPLTPLHIHSPSPSHTPYRKKPKKFIIFITSLLYTIEGDSPAHYCITSNRKIYECLTVRAI